MTEDALVKSPQFGRYFIESCFLRCEQGAPQQDGGLAKLKFTTKFNGARSRVSPQMRLTIAIDNPHTFPLNRELEYNSLVHVAIRIQQPRLPCPGLGGVCYLRSRLHT